MNLARRPADRRARVVELAMLAALALSIVAGAWVLGSAAAPGASDAADARASGFEQSYDEARAAQFDATYEDAWERAYASGAVTGRGEGATAGAAAARAPAR